MGVIEAKRARKWRIDNPDAYKEIKTRYRLKNRMEVLAHYSKNGVPACGCCGEKHYQFLSVDHIEGFRGKGARPKNSGGTTLIEWIRKHNFPKGFQVLCHNCNMAKGFYGGCPHQTIA